MPHGGGYVYRPVWKDPTGKKRTVKTWYISYSVNGKRFRESTHSQDRSTAMEMLRQRVGDRKAGKVIGHPDRVLLSDLFDGVKQYYKRQGNRSLDRAEDAMANLTAFFGEGCRAMAVTKARMNEYQAKRLGEGRAAATVAYETRIASLAWSLAVKNDLLAVPMKFQVPRVNNVRGQFFSDEEFGLLMLELEPAIRPIVQFLYWVPWRRDEARNLKFSACDWENKELRLQSTSTKEKKGRVYPFADSPVEELLKERWKVRTSDDGFIFHDGTGKQLGVSLIRYHWNKATERAGMKGRVLHSLRATSIRNYRLADVPTAEIKALSGHSTDQVFTRYNLVGSKDRAAAVARRFGTKEPQEASSSKGPEKH